MNQRTILGIALLLLSANLTLAQDPKDIEAQREAMKKLEHWIGDWKGTGYYQAGPSARRESGITETIRPKLGGLAILAEGFGQTKDKDTGKEVVTHDAFGIISYDTAKKKYRFIHFRAGDMMGESELQPIEGGVIWERKMERGTVRFTAKIDTTRWHEIGEFSPDGKTWHKFMEMTLTRQKPADGKGKP